MHAAQDTALNRIGQIAVPVRDLDRAVDFYRTKLGMSYLFRAGSLAFFDCDGTRLMLTMPEDGEQACASSVLYYQVDRLEATYQALRTCGVLFDDAPHCVAEMDGYDLWMAFFRDSENNLLALMSDIPRTS